MIIKAFYPHLADAQKAKHLPDVALADDMGKAWLFGGHIKDLSPEGYLGAPAFYDSADVQGNINDYAARISDAILNRIE